MSSSANQGGANPATGSQSNAEQPIRPAATVILVREAATSYEIFMLKRTSSAVFASGMYVFPGGKVDADDHQLEYDAHCFGPSKDQDLQVASLGDDWRGFWLAAIRETFEEAGLMLAYNNQGELVSFAEETVQQRFSAYRDPLHDGQMTMLDICQKEALKLAVDHVHYYNRFVTPLGRPRRFDTCFFIAGAPESQRGSHDEQETVASTWITPQDALARHAAKEFDLMTVTRMQLEALAQYSDKAALLDMAVNNKHFPVSRPVLPPGV